MLCLTTCVGFGYGPRASSPRGFSRQRGITHFACDGSASGLGLTWRADLPARRLAPLPRDNHRPVELPSCVTPPARLLPARAARSPRRPEGRAGGHLLSIAGSGLVGRARVREYQPVVHRLRLSASP